MLGPAVKLWKDLRQHLEDQYGPLIEDWKFYNQKSGWQLKLLKKKRNLFFFTPLDGYFKITFVFGLKLRQWLRKVTCRNQLKKRCAMPKSMEGRGLTVEVKQADDVEHVKKLTEIKIAN